MSVTDGIYFRNAKLDICVFIKETKIHDVNFCAYDDFQELPSPGVVIKD